MISLLAGFTTTLATAMNAFDLVLPDNDPDEISTAVPGLGNVINDGCI